MAQKKKLKSQVAELEKFYDEPVPIMLIKDNAKYKDDLTVTLNGTNYRLQRGVQIMLPRKVALVIERSHKQELDAQAYVDSLKG